MSKMRNSKGRMKEQARKNTQAFKIEKWQLKLGTRNILLTKRIRTGKKNPNWYAVRKQLKQELAEVGIKPK